MLKQKIEIEVLVPDGFRATGEYRPPLKGEWCLFSKMPFYPPSPFRATCDWQAECDRKVISTIILEKLGPKIRTGFINVYAENACDCFHLTRAAANKLADGGRIACIEVKYEVPPQ